MVAGTSCRRVPWEDDVELTGRTAVVTGAAHGIGRALARRLLADGANVVAVDRDADLLARTVAELGDRPEVEAGPARIVAEAADVTDLDALVAVRERAEERFGAVDLVCNNAGIGGRLGPTWELGADDWDRVLAVNLVGVVNGVRAFVPAMVERGEGHVLNTASMAGTLPMPWGSPYVASKHAVVGLSSTLRMELGKAAPGVGVTVLCPGWTATGISEGPDAGVAPGHEDGPAGRMAARLAASVAEGTSAEQVADAAVDAVRDGRFWVLTHADQAAFLLPYWGEAAAAAGVEAATPGGA